MKVKNLDIADSHILLTGATGGIGRESASVLAQAGARIIAVGRDSDALASLIESLPAVTAGAHQYLRADIADPLERERLVKSINDCDQLPNVLINMAGVSDLALFQHQEPARVEQIITTNVTATMLLTQALLPILKRHPDACIVNVGSIFGSIGYPGYVCYCTSKFALRGFSEALQRELSDSPVRVQYFAPRATRTSINSDEAMQLNQQLGNAVDSPLLVARQLLKFLQTPNLTECYLGWPERLFVRVNSLLPSVVSGSIKNKLATIKLFARMGL